MPHLTKIIPLSALAIGLGVAADAADRPTRAEIRDMIETLGISSTDFRSCAMGVRDAFGRPEGNEAPDPARRDALVSCLQEVNPALTPQTIAAAFAELRPAS